MTNPTDLDGMDRLYLHELLGRITDHGEQEQRRLHGNATVWQDWTDRLAALLAELPSWNSFAPGRVLNEEGEAAQISTLVELPDQHEMIQVSLQRALMAADTLTASVIRSVRTTGDHQAQAHTLVAGWLELAAADEAVSQR